jgi:hypothetical protein
MKRVFLLIAVSALLVTLGFAQTPDASSTTDQANVKGCLGGSDGNYTITEDGTRQIFKITTSSVDLKPHLGHDVKLIGHKASGAVGSGAADNSFAVTELNMISEHCAAAAAGPVGTVIPSSDTVIAPVAAAAAAPSATASTPAVDAAAPAAPASPSSATVSAPTVDAAAPAAPVSPSSAPVSTPPAIAAVPAATVSPSPATVSTPAVDAAHPTQRPAHPRRLSATKAAAAAAPAAPVSPAAADAATASPAAADTATTSSPSEAASAPAAAAPTPTATHRAGSLSLLIAFVVLVIVLGTMAPVFGRWRRRKMLERTGTPNLSFTHEASSDLDKPEPRKVA